MVAFSMILKNLSYKKEQKYESTKIQKYGRSVKDISRLLLDLGEDATVVLTLTLTAGRLNKKRE